MTSSTRLRPSTSAVGGVDVFPGAVRAPLAFDHNQDMHGRHRTARSRAMNWALFMAGIAGTRREAQYGAGSTRPARRSRAPSHTRAMPEMSEYNPNTHTSATSPAPGWAMKYTPSATDSSPQAASIHSP